MEQKQPLIQILIFSIISLLIIIAGIFLYLHQGKVIRNDINSDLTYISILKVNQIDLWLKEKRRDAQELSNNKWLIEDIYKFITKKDEKAFTNINQWLKNLKESNNDYSDILLVDKNFETKIKVNNELLDYENIKMEVQAAFTTKKIQFLDIHKHSNGNLRLGFAIPLNYKSEIIGVILLVINPKINLFPLVQTWLTESKTAETLICRPDSNGVVFLNSLRHNKNSALKLRFPLTRTEIPAVQAALGYKGIYEGRDYRGSKVLSYIQKIPGTNWSMVAKIDYDEVMSPLFQRLVLVASLLLLIIITFGFIFSYSWKANQIKYYKEKYQLEIDKQKQEELLEVIFQALPVGIWIHDKDGVMLNQNKKAKEIWSGAEDTYLKSFTEGKSSWYMSGELVKQEDWPLWKTIKKGETFHNQTIILECTDASKRIIDNSIVPVIYDKEIIGAVVVSEDITNIKNTENIIQKSLHEKEILLKELFHRTKNNMQIISSIISLQALEKLDPKMSLILQEMKNRIQTIALVHEQLYRSNEFASLDLKEYIEKLIHLLIYSFTEESSNIEIIKDLESITVLLDTAVPCGLIVNELLSNAIKYAFPNKEKGSINIMLKKHKDIIELSVHDNGVGVPSNFNILGKDTLGISLLKNIVEGQLMGDIKVESNHGMKFIITFKDTLHKG
ncbi:MAG TPA: histidine kinase dimerization/phosphoacceptor domain -containing protein [Ignavibacteriaceae bacterium]|nr:histidine kinase dimerization/phosphoacceptor domain -containing protein [Ignavibacteriaceae bacterium]